MCSVYIISVDTEEEGRRKRRRKKEEEHKDEGGGTTTTTTAAANISELKRLRKEHVARETWVSWQNAC